MRVNLYSFWRPVRFRGGYAKPKYTDVLICQLVLLPVTLFKFTMWHIKWIWRFNIRKEEYGENEKLYMIRKNMGLKEHAFEVRNNVCFYSLLYTCPLSSMKLKLFEICHHCFYSLSCLAIHWRAEKRISETRAVDLRQL